MGKPEGKRLLGRPRLRWEDNIKMNLREVGFDAGEWIDLPIDRVQWQVYVKAVIYIYIYIYIQGVKKFSIQTLRVCRGDKMKPILLCDKYLTGSPFHR